MKTIEINNYQQALSFAKEHHGFAEGPFMDENLNKWWIVFYKD